jgi:uncharacterized damage-inducible protein DinB
MKRLLGITLLWGAGAGAATLTPEERDRAVNHLLQTRAAFLKSIEGLSAEQWSFKPAPNAWSVGEVAEHITVSEGSILDLVTKKILAAPVDPAKIAETQGKDDAVLRMIPDRSEKFQAPAFLQPQARWSQAALPAEFNARRDRTIAYIRATPDELRSHTLAHPAMKTLDAYQWILLISAHAQRHTAQIEEVKAHPGFPKRQP